MEALIEALPNLGVGVASIGAVMYVTFNFLKSSKEERKEHRQEREDARKEHRQEREEYIKDMREVRTSLIDQLSKNTVTMERVISHIDRK